MTIFLRTNIMVRISDDKLALDELANLLDMVAEFMERTAAEGDFTEDAQMRLKHPVGFNHDTPQRLYQVAVDVRSIPYERSVFAQGGPASIGRLPPR